MTVDDDRESRPAPRRRLLWWAAAAVAAVVLLTLYSATVLPAGPEGAKPTPERLAITAGLFSGLLLIGWAVLAAAWMYVRLWRTVLQGESVHATVTVRESTADSDGDLRWSVRVTGRTTSGDAFDRGLDLGYTEPGPLGSTMRVRYHTGMRKIWAVDPVGRMIAAVVVGHLIAVATAMTLTALTVLIVAGLVDVWQ
ncbi:hypothetical protein [Catellatospora vulcania]|uniref:hypothetical protein n=1 Tax=Catellatospora vulcania TaxID=1460450 RepID=UPI0012D4001A|nr:hypothetical protein [Catellatospora vulcania]